MAILEFSGETEYNRQILAEIISRPVGILIDLYLPLELSIL
jgi:hypothetical protein